MKLLIILCSIYFLLVQSVLLEDYHTDIFLTKNNNKYVSLNNGRNESLQMVTVMFRHGNRTSNGPDELYPNDPHLNYSYFPYGYGQLTNSGKAHAFLVGMALRKRYKKFLGDVYYPDIVEAITTDVDRTKMSLQLALAGLFPPSEHDIHATGIPWQAVPYKYVPISQDRVLQGTRCPNYQELYNKFISLPATQNKFKAHKKIFDYISKYSGLNTTTINDLYRLHFGLRCEEEFGFSLPEWTKMVWPEIIMKIAAEEILINMGLPDMAKMAIGYFIEKFINDANNKIQEISTLPRKIHIYAAHENTLGQLLVALGVYEMEIPTYGSYIILELHKINGIYGIKLLYNNWDGRGLRTLKIPHCKEFCATDNFKALVSKYLPTPELCDNELVKEKKILN